MAWWLAYEELYGDMDKEYPIMKKQEDERKVTVLGGQSEDIISASFPSSNYAGDTVSYLGGNDKISFDYGTSSLASSLDPSFWDDDGTSITGNPYSSPDTLNFSSAYSQLVGGMGNDHISVDYAPGYDPLTSDYDPYPTLSLVSDSQARPQPNLKYQRQKYGEDKGIADLKDYVSSTYQGHYTNDNSDVQTLDLIHSVGDAESFCRSNALKYLSRYDKKGQAKRDILKAMHYCLLLYYFSGNTNNETPTRGYETF